MTALLEDIQRRLDDVNARSIMFSGILQGKE
jgi:hypothetical protein